MFVAQWHTDGEAYVYVCAVHQHYKTRTRTLVVFVQPL